MPPWRMTPEEHRREAERLRRERPHDPESQGSAAAREQIAWVIELLNRREIFWIAGVTISAFYFLAHFWSV